MYVYVFVNISVGRYGHFSYRHIADTQYYRAQMGLGKIETFCACHRLFNNYSVILNHVCLREREPGSTNNLRSMSFL